MANTTSVVKEWLAHLDVLEPARAGGLQVFGLRHRHPAALEYLTLDEVLESSTFEITELGKGGQVPTLQVRNRGDSMVFLMAGEELLGAKQNRVLNVSIMVGGRSKTAIPVSCVESGRWRFSSRTFRSAGTSSHARLRAKMAVSTTCSYRESGEPRSDQSGVWQEVAIKMSKMGSSSRTEALHQMYLDQKKRLRGIVEKTPAPDDCCGVVFAHGGRVAGVDLFDQPRTLTKLWPKLLRSYAVDALETQKEKEASRTLTRDQVEGWLRTAVAASTDRYKAAGVGEDVRFTSGGITGGCLLVEGTPVHTELFEVVE